jgi:hypothetical protein
VAERQQAIFQDIIPVSRDCFCAKHLEVPLSVALLSSVATKHEGAQHSFLGVPW